MLHHSLALKDIFHNSLKQCVVMYFLCLLHFLVTKTDEWPPLNILKGPYQWFCVFKQNSYHLLRPSVSATHFPNHTNVKQPNSLEFRWALKSRWLLYFSDHKFYCGPHSLACVTTTLPAVFFFTPEYGVLVDVTMWLFNVEKCHLYVLLCSFLHIVSLYTHAAYMLPGLHNLVIEYKCVQSHQVVSLGNPSYLFLNFIHHTCFLILHAWTQTNPSPIPLMSNLGAIATLTMWTLN